MCRVQGEPTAGEGLQSAAQAEETSDALPLTELRPSSLNITPTDGDLLPDPACHARQAASLLSTFLRPSHVDPTRQPL